MKKTVKLFLSVLLTVVITSCSKGNYSNMESVSIMNPDSAINVSFEEVATDIRIVPLISDEPLDRSGEVRSYGNETFIRSADGKYIYYFVDGQMISKLNRVGRGRGEYLSITNYVYSPSSHTLYVHSLTDGEVLQYTVPDMRFKRSFKIEQLTGFAEHDDSTLIARLEDKEKKESGIYFLDVNTGKTIGKLKTITGFSGVFNGKMEYYQPKHRILSEMGSKNIISEVPEKIGGKEKELYVYDFGTFGVPEKYDDISQYDIPGLMRLAQYVKEKSEVVYVGGFNCQVNKQDISFWYRRINTENKAEMIYYWTNGKEFKKYAGFRAAGMRFPIIPDALTDDGYVSIIEGDKDFIFDSQQELSSVTEQIKKEMSNQKLDNPVLIYYRIQ